MEGERERCRFWYQCLWFLDFFRISIEWLTTLATTPRLRALGLEPCLAVTLAPPFGVHSPKRDLETNLGVLEGAGREGMRKGFGTKEPANTEV